jgi:hypothetical protein
MSFDDEYKDAIALGDKAILLDLLNNSWAFDSKNGNLEVAILDPITQRHSSWMSWWYVRDHPVLIERVNNRLIGWCEIAFDFDPMVDESAFDLAARVVKQVARLRADGAIILGTFSTGSRGYHIHVLMPDLSLCTREQMRQIKLFLLKKYGADLTKGTPRSMIAIELASHFKTGSPKMTVQL